MSRVEAAQVRRVGVIGTGVIGGGWTAHFLRQGLEVFAYDPAPKAEARLRRRIDDLWPMMERLGLKQQASPSHLTFTSSLPAAIHEVDFVQESVPEREQLKTKIITEIDAAASPEVVIASSTSGIPVTALQNNCLYPERCIVGHPFVPPYLLPLVEVVGGKQTDPEVVDWTVEFYRSIGKRPLRLDRELPGFLANRLQEAIWREALHLIGEGLATVEEVDAALVYGPGLRWSVFGLCMIYHLGGGEGGMEHFLDQFGPALNLPWSYLQAPELTPELRNRLVDGSIAEAAGRSIRELERERDECLVAILEALDKYRQKSSHLSTESTPS